MAKILISPLGVGGRFKEQNSLDREYQEANYRIDQKNYKNRFMASALYDHLNLDGIIFIGTVRSMWEEVYRFFCEKNNHNFDDEYWIDLATKIDTMDHRSDLKALDLSLVRDVIGERSKCILIKYGINDTELWENLDLIFQVVELLKNGDEVYIDITHSFRSLSLFLFLVLTFIKDLPESENIKIAGVYYGMLDISKEMGYTPVIDLRSLFDLTDWIKGGYILNRYGDGNLIAQLLKQQGETQLANQILQLSSAININFLPAIRQKSKPLQSSLRNVSIEGPFKYVQDTLSKFIKKVSNSSEDSESQFQLKLAGWYFDNNRYATGYITLAEAIITYLCEIQEKDFNNKDNREKVKSFFFSEYRDTDLAKEFHKVNAIRKQIAHASLEENCESYSQAIKQAKKHHQNISRIFQTGRIM